MFLEEICDVVSSEFRSGVGAIICSMSSSFFVFIWANNSVYIEFIIFSDEKHPAA